MAKITELSTSADGTGHVVSVHKSWSKYIVSVDGTEYNTYKIGKNSTFGPNEDFLLDIYGQSYIIALRGNKIRLVNDNAYIDNGEAFVPAKPFPKWYWVFFVLNIALVCLGGAIPAGFGAGGAAGCAGIMHTNKSTANKVILCCVITVGCWLGAIILSVVLVNFLYAVI